MIDFKTAKPREIEGYLREVVRKAFGDAVENKATIYSKRGYYAVSIDTGGGKYVEFQNFRRSDAGKIAKAIRAMK